jgi:hypothetical protein
MANLEDDLHAVFIITCSALEQAGLTRLKTYVTRRLTYTEMAKRMASRTQAEGQMLLGQGLGLLGTVLMFTCLVNLRKLRIIT